MSLCYHGRMYRLFSLTFGFKCQLALGALFLGVMNWATAELAPGDRLPDLINLQDQHEVAYPMPDGVNHVAVAFTMGMGKAPTAILQRRARIIWGPNMQCLLRIFTGCPRSAAFLRCLKCGNIRTVLCWQIRKNFWMTSRSRRIGSRSSTWTRRG